MVALLGRMNRVLQRAKKFLAPRPFLGDNASEQIVGRERRGRVSQLEWCGEGCFDSRRRVNSTVRPQIVS